MKNCVSKTSHEIWFKLINRVSTLVIGNKISRFELHEITINVYDKIVHKTKNLVVVLTSFMYRSYPHKITSNNQTISHLPFQTLWLVFVFGGEQTWLQPKETNMMTFKKYELYIDSEESWKLGLHSLSISKGPLFCRSSI